MIHRMWGGREAAQASSGMEFSKRSWSQILALSEKSGYRSVPPWTGLCGY